MSNLESSTQHKPAIQQKALPVIVTFYDAKKPTMQSRDFDLRLHSERVSLNKLIMWGANQGIQMTMTPLS